MRDGEMRPRILPYPLPSTEHPVPSTEHPVPNSSTEYLRPSTAPHTVVNFSHGEFSESTRGDVRGCDSAAVSVRLRCVVRFRAHGQPHLSKLWAAVRPTGIRR